MAEQIRKSDIIQGNPFDEISKEISVALGQLEKFDNGVKSVAKELSTLTVENKKTVQGIEAITKAEKESEKLMAEKLRNMKLEQQLLVEQEKVKQAQIRTEQQLQKATQAQTKAIQNEANAYKQLERATRDQKNESKRLGAELLKLEADGKKNTKAFRDLEKQYKETTAAAQKGDAQLKKLDKTVGDNFRNVGNYSKAVSGLKSVLGSLGVAFGASQVVGFLKETTELSRIQEKAVAQVAAGLESTGNAVGYSLDQLKAKASEFQGQTLFGDEQILTDLTSVMLTFTNVTGKAFDGAQQAALDLSTRMGGDLKGAAVQLGKALNDPIQGVTALRRVGVSFTDSQLAQIKVLQESGDLMGAQTIILNEMNKEFAGSAAAAAEADGGITQLSNAWGDAKEMLGKMILEGLKPTITSLKDFFSNLKPEDIQRFVGYIGQLFSVFKRLAQAYLVLKVAQLAFADSTGKLNFSFKQLKDNVSSSTSGLGKLGGALKGIGITAAIGLFIELGTEIYRVASGAADAERAIEGMNRAISKGGDMASKRIQSLNDEIGLGNITEAQKIQDVKNEIKLLNIRREKLKLALEEYKAGSLYQAAIAKNPALRTFEEAGAIGVAQGLRSSLYEVDAALTTYNRELKDMKITQIQANESTKTLTDNTKKQAKDTKDLNEQLKVLLAYLRDVNKEQSRLIEVQKLSLDPDATERALELEREREITVANIALLKAKIAGDEQAIIDAQLKLIDAEEKRDLFNETDPAKQEEIKLNATLRRLELQKSAEEKALAKEKEIMQERMKVIEDFQRAITQMLTEQIDQRIELLEQEKQAAASQQNYLEQLAANGNITAQQSIAEQIQLQREAQAEQARLERMKQNVELISAGLSTFNQQISNGKSPGEALASTILSTQTLVGFLKNLQFFAKGTDYAPEGLAVVDEKGAEIITDAQGRIKDIGSNEGARFKYLNKGDKVITATETSRILNGFESVNNAGKISKSDHAGNGYDLMILNRSLKDVKQAIEHNKVDIDLHMETFAGGMAQIVKSERRGKDIVFNKYRVK